MKRSYLLTLGVIALSAVFYGAGVMAQRIRPAHVALETRTERDFTEGQGWFPGEALVSAQPVRAWGSWCGDDDRNGSLTIGPFPAPGQLRIAVGGYPTKPGNQLYLEHVATKKRFDLSAGDVGERWNVVARDLPAEWRNQPIVLQAIDGAKGHGGWLAVTEPLRGGGGNISARMWKGFALMTPVLALLWYKPRTPAIRSVPTSIRFERFAPWLVGSLVWVPFLWCAASLADVWWFGDEWDQLDQIARMGFWQWTIHPFGENVVPLFKAIWGGLALASGGAYWPMLTAVWFTHAINTALLARLLRRVEFSWVATLAGCATFALPAANVEVLAWSIQWSNVLAILFLLLGVDWVLQQPPVRNGAARKSNLMLMICSAGSAATFVRGVLTGIVLAAGALFANGDPRRWATRWRPALFCLVPSAAVILWIFLAAPGNHHDLGKHGLFLKAAEFAAWFWAAVPFHRLLEVTVWDGRTTLVLGLAKSGLIVTALVRARGPMRHLLALLALFDLGNAALLGLGRHQTGLAMTNSSRYYYGSLICLAPFVAFALDTWSAAIPRRWARNVFGALAAAAVAFCVMRAWPGEAEAFANGRGRNTREMLFHDPTPPEIGAVPGIPFLTTSRAKELIVMYHLH